MEPDGSLPYLQDYDTATISNFISKLYFSVNEIFILHLI
jgi:hypothetical protein